MILICAASNGKNLENARRIAEQAKEIQLDTHTLDLVNLQWPLYSPLTEQKIKPPHFSSVQHTFSDASGFIFCSPEYNGSIPPVLSNLIAWLSVASDDFRGLFNGKMTALSTHSGGHGQKVLLAMRVQFSHLGCNVIGRDLVSTSDKPLRKEAIESVLRQFDSL